MAFGKESFFARGNNLSDEMEWPRGHLETVSEHRPVFEAHESRT